MMKKLLQKVIYKSDAMQQLRRNITPILKTGAPVLFWGEAGSGMGNYVRAIHEDSRTGRLLRKPCFEIDEDNVEELFFGTDERMGWLEEFDGGTIFLKHVTEAASGVQEFLRHIISNQSVDGRFEFSRKKAATLRRVNVRFMFSMVKDYDAAVKEGLLTRECIETLKTHGQIIHFPSLRQRTEDIPGIVGNFIEEFNKKYQQRVTGIEPKAERCLVNYRWPGNIDRLKRTIEGIFASYPGISQIMTRHLPEEIICAKDVDFDYRFSLTNEECFSGAFLSTSFQVQAKSKDKSILTIETGNLEEIARVDDDSITPRLSHFIVKLKNGDRFIVNFVETELSVRTASHAERKINVLDLAEIKSL